MRSLQLTAALAAALALMSLSPSLAQEQKNADKSGRPAASAPRQSAQNSGAAAGVKEAGRHSAPANPAKPAGRKKPGPRPGPGQPGSNQVKAKADDETAAPLAPAKYFQLMIERQRLLISSDKQILIILEAYRGDPVRAMHDLKKHEREKQARLHFLYHKYGTSPQDYLRSRRGTREQKKRAKYLDAHPGIRDELAAHSKELSALDKEVWHRLSPLWTGQRPR